MLIQVLYALRNDRDNDLVLKVIDDLMSATRVAVIDMQFAPVLSAVIAASHILIER